MPKEFRSDINALRALSVSSVVAFHFGIWPFSGGFAGVDVFFVISGFLMTSIVLGGTRSAMEPRAIKAGRIVVDFYLARIRRIVPALAAMLIVLLAAGAFALDPLAYGTLGLNALASFSFVSNLLYMMQADYFAASANTNLLLHTWSLSVEWQFYILYPIFLVCVEKYFPRHTTKIYWAVALASLLLSGVVTAAWPTYGYFLLPTRAWEMMAGGLVVLIPQASPNRPWLKRVLLVGGITAIFFSIVFFDAYDYWPGVGAVIPAIGAVAVLLASRPGRWSTNPVSYWLGVLSYSLYLYHWPIYCLAVYLKVPMEAPTLLALFGLTLVLSYLSYTLVEMPSRKLFRGGVSLRELASGINGYALSAGVALLFAAIGVTATHGLPERVRVADAPRIFADIRRSSKDWAYPKNCAYTYDPVSGEADLRSCMIGNAEASHKIAVFGDSIAQQLFPYLRSLTVMHRDYSFTFFTYGGCPPVPDVELRSPGFRCRDFVQRVQKQLEQSRFEKVLIVSLWTTYFDDNNRNKIHAGKLCFERGGECVSPSNDEEAERLIAETFDRFATMMRSIGNGGTKPVVVLTMPYSPYDVPRELARRIHWREPLDTLRIFSVAVPRSDRAYVEPMLRHAAASVGAEIYDPLPDTCRNGRCYALGAKGYPLYRDRPHITASFAETIRLFGLDRLIGIPN
jgi:peptidoglycan/LPS O-acetylase OafA/YrhL